MEKKVYMEPVTELIRFGCVIATSNTGCDAPNTLVEIPIPE